MPANEESRGESHAECLDEVVRSERVGLLDRAHQRHPFDLEPVDRAAQQRHVAEVDERVCAPLLVRAGVLLPALPKEFGGRDSHVEMCRVVETLAEWNLPLGMYTTIISAVVLRPVALRASAEAKPNVNRPSCCKFYLLLRQAGRIAEECSFMSSPMSSPTFIGQLISPDIYTNYRPGASIKEAVRDLGVLGDLVGTWMGTGFNLITLPAFGPKEKNSGAREEFRVLADATREILEFEPIGASFPNRGSFKEPDSPAGQPDIDIYGVRYHQRVANAENHQPMHMESGFWLIVPETTIPPLPESVVRQAVIPHGTSLLALGPCPQYSEKKPCFDLASPFPVEHAGRRPDFNPGYLHDFLHPDHSSALAKFKDLIVKVDAPPAPSEWVLDANQALRKVIDGQQILKTVSLKASAKNPDKPRITCEPEIDEFKQHGRIASIPFLAAKNADVTEFESTFWVETVDSKGSGPPFLQLQYSQRVVLDFLGADWPHISVATLIKQ